MCGIRITKCTGIGSTGIGRKLKELPQAVLDAIAKSYEGCAVKEAYVAETDEAKKYKIVLVDKDQKEQTIVLNEQGEVIE